MRVKLLEAFKLRWFLCDNAEAAAVPAAELCMLLRALHSDRTQATVLPLAHDHCLRKLLTAILCDDADSQSTKAVPKDKFRKVLQPLLFHTPQDWASATIQCIEDGLFKADLPVLVF